jgi:uncharacterized protein YndB with AHSA1/START domain
MKENNESNRAITNIRAFNAPREVVFNAWADPEQLMQWWGPNGFTNTFHEFDFKPGGTWKFTMHSPEGQDFLNTCIFEKIEKPERIVFQHLLPMHKFQLTASFEVLGGKTKLTFHQVFETVEECERIKKYVVEANEQNLDRLEKVLSNNLNKNKTL